MMCVLYLWLDHALSLCAKQLDRLEQVDDAFISHSLKDDAQRYEDARSSDASTTYTTHGIAVATGDGVYRTLTFKH